MQEGTTSTEGWVCTYYYPTNIAVINLVSGCPNARADVRIVEKKTLRVSKFGRCAPIGWIAVRSRVQAPTFKGRVTCVARWESVVLSQKERFRVGQNVAVTWSLSREPPKGAAAEFERLIRAWFDEVRHFRPEHIQPFVFTKKLGHYTQVTWLFFTHVFSKKKKRNLIKLW